MGGFQHILFGTLKCSHSILFCFREPLDRAESVDTQLLRIFYNSWWSISCLHPSGWKHRFSHLEFSAAVKVCILWCSISLPESAFCSTRRTQNGDYNRHSDIEQTWKMLFWSSTLLNPSAYKSTASSGLKVLLGFFFNFAQYTSKTIQWGP